MNIIGQLLAKFVGEAFVAKLANVPAPANPGKGLVQSKTVWGAAIAIFGPYLTARFGLGEGDVAELVYITEQALGGALLIYGRIKAVKPIGIAPGK